MTLKNRTRPAALPALMSQTIDVFPTVLAGVDCSINAFGNFRCGSSH